MKAGTRGTQLTMHEANNEVYINTKDGSATFKEEPVGYVWKTDPDRVVVINGDKRNEFFAENVIQVSAR
jgi:hypothetical protein